MVGIMFFSAFCFLIASASAVNTFYGDKLITVKPQTVDQLEFLRLIQLTSDLDFWKQAHAVGHPADIRVTPSQLGFVNERFAEKGLKYAIRSHNIQGLVDNEKMPRTRYSASDILTRYASQTEIDAWLSSTASACGSRCSLMEFGRSVENRDMKVIKITSGTGGSDPKPSVFIDGGIHAREWISPVFVNNIISKLINDYDSDTVVKTMVDAYDWYVIPLLNPDGYNYSHTTDRMWRKNRAETSKRRCTGVDLNRNFGYQWGVDGVSTNPCSEIYLGTEAFSEPEAKNLKNFLATIPNLNVYLTFHSYGQYILYPWGYGRDYAPNHNDLDDVGNAMNDAIKSLTGENWIVGNAAIELYPAAGASDDWAYGGAGATYAYCIELPPDDDTVGFLLPESRIPSVVSSVWPGVKAMMMSIIQKERLMMRWQEPTHYVKPMISVSQSAAQAERSILADNKWWKKIAAKKQQQTA